MSILYNKNDDVLYLLVFPRLQKSSPIDFFEKGLVFYYPFLPPPL